ncbi:MAG: helix-turn-helix domain-containing protein [Bryobacteraceae bacterium]
MPITIAGQTYHSASELADELGISRQTLWRWRDQKKIPPGLRYRSGQVLFTDDEAQTIREFANRLEPIEPGTPPSQMKLFLRPRGKGKAGHA